MGKSPNLEVPQADQAQGRGGLSGSIFVLLLILIVVQVMSFFVSDDREDGLATVSSAALPPLEQVKEVAVDLENKNISNEAADLWEQYLEMAGLGLHESGNIRYRIGKLRQAAGEYHQAFAQYALAEKLLGDSNPDIAHEIQLRRMECLRQLGQYADLAREVAARASSDGGEEDGSLEGQQVVAQVDGERFTLSDLDRMLGEQIDLAVKSQMGMSAEEEDAFRKRIYERLADPKEKMRQVQQLITTRVLAKESRERKVHQTQAFRDRLVAMADEILASTLLFEEVNRRASVTDADIERFYEANQDRYAQSAATFIAHILCRSETHARDVIRKIEGGASFEDVAEAESLDSGTRAKGGMLNAPVSADSEYVPLFGANKDLHDVIREAAAGEVLGQPYESVQGWHVIKVVSHRERIEQPLEEIREQVRRDTLNARKREVTEQYIKELFEKHKAKLYPEVLQSAEVAEDSGEDQ